MSTLEQTLQSQNNDDSAPSKDFDREQWKQQKHQELEETSQQLNDSTMKVIQDPDRFKAFLDIQAELPAISVGNALLIHDQRSEPVTRLATFDEWRDQGRAVKRGETGCRILSPVTYKRADGSDGTSFRVSRVFDITQTHGDPVSEAPIATIPADQMVRVLFSKSPVKIVADGRISEDIGAAYDHGSKTIHVHGKLPDDIAVGVLAREMAKALLYMQQEDPDHDRIAFAGQSAAYLIQKRYGQEPLGVEPSMVQNYAWPDDPIAVRATLNDARQAANMVCQRIERGLENREQSDAPKPVRKPSEPSR